MALKLTEIYEKDSVVLQCEENRKAKNVKEIWNIEGIRINMKRCGSCRSNGMSTRSRVIAAESSGQ